MAEIRLAYLVTHPIQYQAPLLGQVAREPGLDLTVFFAAILAPGNTWTPTSGGRSMGKTFPNGVLPKT